MAENEVATVFGIFADQSAAEQAIAELERAGFRGDQISKALHGPEREHPGRTVVAVGAHKRFPEARAILERFGATIEPIPSAPEDWDERMPAVEYETMVSPNPEERRVYKAPPDTEHIVGQPRLADEGEPTNWQAIHAHRYPADHEHEFEAGRCVICGEPRISRIG